MTDDGVTFRLGAGEALRFSHDAMATVFEVRCVHEDARYARQAADAAFALVDSLEQQLSRFVANSDISRVNALAVDQSTRVGSAALDCLVIARHLFDVTSGAFDVSLGTGLEALELDPETHTVRARKEGVRLDLGGIGKGFAVDRVAELLGEWDVRRALVHGGFSSVLALEGPPGGDGWPVSLSVPGGDEVLARLSARGQAFSASGTRKGEHIQDPRTGRRVTGRAVWVSIPGGAATGGAPAAVADGLSTAFMILDRAEIGSLCRECPGLEAWILEVAAEGDPPELLHVTGAE